MMDNKKPFRIGTVFVLVEMRGIEFSPAGSVGVPEKPSTGRFLNTAPVRSPMMDNKKTVPSRNGFCFGGDEGDRTPYLLNAIQALSQVSYTPKRQEIYYHKKSDLSIGKLKIIKKFLRSGEDINRADPARRRRRRGRARCPRAGARAESASEKADRGHG